jgi:uncharacterized protein YunC (DUF1805 family)
MINGNLKQFLDTGWWNADATLFYKNHIYFFDGYFDVKHNMHLKITKWKAKNIDNKTFENILSSKGDLIDYQCIEIDGQTEEEVREKMLKAKIFENKSFWQVEKELIWLD